MRRFERELNGTRRFWEIDLQAERLRFHTGEVGRAGRVRTQVQRTPEAAAAELARAVAEMIAGGWSEVAPQVEPAPPRPPGRS
jgi:predicted DNA-binding WGR domain protein